MSKWWHWQYSMKHEMMKWDNFIFQKCILTTEQLPWRSGCLCVPTLPLNTLITSSQGYVAFLSFFFICCKFMSQSRISRLHPWYNGWLSHLECNRSCKNVFDKLVDLIIIIPNRDIISTQFISFTPPPFFSVKY